MASGTVDHLVRRELRNFCEIGDSLRLNAADRRRALALSEQAWRDWTDTLAGGPMPAEPSVPGMLLRLGSGTYALAMMAERLQEAA